MRSTRWVSLTKAEIAENKQLHVRALNMLGVVYRRIDDIRRALDYHQEALALAESIDRTIRFGCAALYTIYGD